MKDWFLVSWTTSDQCSSCTSETLGLCRLPPVIPAPSVPSSGFVLPDAFEVLAQTSIPPIARSSPSRASRRWDLGHPVISDVSVKLMDPVLTVLISTFPKLPLFGNQETHFLWQKETSAHTHSTGALSLLPADSFMITCCLWRIITSSPWKKETP